MLAEERKRRILDIVNTNKIVKVNELSELLNTTEVTIRKDLDDLQTQKLLRRIHGGAISYSPANEDIPVNLLATRCINEKKAIAQLAYQYIDDKDVLIFDRSTTVFELAKLLINSSLKDLTILTHSMPLINILKVREDFKLIILGGQFYPSYDCTYGSLANKMLSGLRADKCFLGITGIDPSYGYSDPNLNHCDLKNSMLHSAKQRFILADHTKFNASYIGKCADFIGEVDYLITDTLPPHIDRAEYNSHVNLIVVDEVTQN